MAKIRASGLFERASGKVGDIVYVDGQNGNYIRKRVKPRNPQTQNQMFIRSNMSEMSRCWSKLSDNERRSWIDTRDVIKRGKYGNSYVYGFSLFLKRNLQLIQYGLPITRVYKYGYDKPAYLRDINIKVRAKKEIEDISISYNCEHFNNQYLVIWGTGLFSRGMKPLNKMFEILSILDMIKYQNKSSISIIEMYEKVFGKYLIMGKKIAFRLMVISGDTGEVSQKQEVVVDLQ